MSDPTTRPEPSELPLVDGHEAFIHSTIRERLGRVWIGDVKNRNNCRFVLKHDGKWHTLAAYTEDCFWPSQLAAEAFIRQQAAITRPEPSENCGQCITCLDALPPDDNPTPRSRRRMVVCAVCGNKRCPHATDHRHACTGSNASGQLGSRFGPQGRDKDGKCQSCGAAAEDEHDEKCPYDKAVKEAAVCEPEQAAGAQLGIYVASRASIPERSAMWRDKRAAGVPIISSWIDEAGHGETKCLKELWSRIVAEIEGCQCLVFYAEPSDMPIKGAFVEAGIAIGLGKPVIVCLPGFGPMPKEIGSWTSHGSVLRVDNLDAALHGAMRPAVQSPPGDARLPASEQRAYADDEPVLADSNSFLIARIRDGKVDSVRVSGSGADCFVRDLPGGRMLYAFSEGWRRADGKPPHADQVCYEQFIPAGHHVVEDADGERFVKNEPAPAPSSPLPLECEWSILSVPMGHRIEWSRVVFQRHDRDDRPALRQLTEAINGWHKLQAGEGATWPLTELQAKLTAVEAERDRLADALRACIEQLSPSIVDVVIKPGCMPYSLKLAKDVLDGVPAHARVDTQFAGEVKG